MNFPLPKLPGNIEGYLERGYDEYTTRPLVVEIHMAIAPTEPGIGVTFDWDKLERAHTK